MPRLVHRNGHQPELAHFGGPKAVTQPYPAYPVVGSEEAGAVMKVLMDRQLSITTHSGVIAEFEESYAKYFGSRYCHSFNSGTAAIHSALFAVGVKPGCEVLTASHTWISGIMAICHAGGTPVFCDIKPGTHHIDPDEIRRKAGPNTKAVIVTHLWGLPADMDPILKAAREKNLAVIEDVSHAHGGTYKGRYLGTIGDCGAFSLQGSKAIVAGEGGFMLTNSKLFFERSMVPGDHGLRLGQTVTLKELSGFTRGGGAWTYRMAPLCAAVAVEQLKRLKTLNAARQANFDRLAARLRKIDFIRWPKLPPRSVRGWYGAPAEYRYDQRRVSRDLFLKACQAEGARLSGNGYKNWYVEPIFQDWSLYSQMFPVRHDNGVMYRPLAPGSLVNNEKLREHMMLFPIPATEEPALMDQLATAVEKVAANMARLAAEQKKDEPHRARATQRRRGGKLLTTR